jgi:hypothetical protein
MSTDVIASSSTKGISLFVSSSIVQHFNSLEQQMTKMDTSNTDLEPTTTEDTLANGVEESSTQIKGGKRKRSTKKAVETDETNISNARPRRTLPKRKHFFLAFLNNQSRNLGEEVPAPVINGSGRGSKIKAQRNSAEQAAGDADDEQERDKNIPILHDVADVVWVKMGGHPW